MNGWIEITPEALDRAVFENKHSISTQIVARVVAWGIDEGINRDALVDW